MLNEAVFLVGTQAQILFQHQLNMPKAPSTVVQQHAEAFSPVAVSLGELSRLENWLLLQRHAG